MAVHDGRAYVISRGIVPPRLTEIDLTTRRVTRTVELPVGEGGWGITVAAGKVFVGLYPVADVYLLRPGHRRTHPGRQPGRSRRLRLGPGDLT